jgi:hypothetical protein
MSMTYEAVLAEDDRLHQFWQDNKEKREDTDKNIQYWDRVVSWGVVEQHRFLLREQKGSEMIDFPVSHTWQRYYAERGMMPFPPPARVTHTEVSERRSDDFGLGSVDEDRMASLERRMSEQVRELRGLRERIARGDTPPRAERQARAQSTGVQRIRRTNSGNDTDIQG